jgi:hypothetical protein
MDFEPVTVGLEPMPHSGVFVIRSIVLNEDRSLPPVAARELFHEGQVGVCIEYGVLSVMKSRVPEFDCAQNLHALALPGDRNLWWTTSAAPGRVQCGILTEAGFVGKDQRPAFRAGFFLRLG